MWLAKGRGTKSLSYLLTERKEMCQTVSSWESGSRVNRQLPKKPPPRSQSTFLKLEKGDFPFPSLQSFFKYWPKASASFLWKPRFLQHFSDVRAQLSRQRFFSISLLLGFSGCLPCFILLCFSNYNEMVLKLLKNKKFKKVYKHLLHYWKFPINLFFQY